MGAVKLFPKHNMIVIDLGTATTFSAISQEHEYLGGVIMAGMLTSCKALSQNAAKLSSVEIVKPENILGKNTLNVCSLAHIMVI